MNKQMRLFSKELICYIHEVYAKNNKLWRNILQEGEILGWCRCCGEKIKEGDQWASIKSVIMDSPELAKNTSDLFSIHHNNCVEGNKKFIKLQKNKSLNKKIAIQLIIKDIPSKKKDMDSLEKFIDLIDKDRIKLMQMIDREFKGNLSSVVFDRKVRMLNRGKIIGDHLRLIGNDYKTIRK